MSVRRNLHNLLIEAFRDVLEEINQNEKHIQHRLGELIVTIEELNNSVAALTTVTADVLAYIKANPAVDTTPQVQAINAAVAALSGAITAVATPTP